MRLGAQKADIGGKNAAQGKLGANREGLDQVVEVFGKGAYKLRTVEGAQMPRTWHISNLKRATYKVVGTDSMAPHRTDHPDAELQIT
ncbi:hypothetical protein PIB30_036189 [Stylosanthes scabra]|uniref:Uncharacterized protein n=1 Tax=Stylosanthes scabra TaxID=79078 RepID=A0ABU6SDK6_9FABA|nr:hypothetical protein [Stylosanthes scabra]